MDEQPLLTGGEHRRADWEAAAAAVLRRAGRMGDDDPDDAVWAKLTRTTLDGIEVPPLGIPEDLEGLPSAGVPGAAPYTRGSVLTPPEHGWDVRAHLADPDPDRAAADAVIDLENGVTSLWLSVGDGGIKVEHLPNVLAEVYVDLAPVALDSPADPLGAAAAFCALLTERDVRPAPGTVLGVDPVGAELRGHAPHDGDHTAVVHRLTELAGRHGALAATVDGTAVHDLGATDAQELGYTLAVGAELLRAMTADGLTVGEAADLLEFRYAATDEQLPSIAKLRAARRLWHRVLELSGAPDAAGQRQHAVTSRPMLTKHDPWVNMLRTTVAAFAAGTAGATCVTVLPFDTALGLPDATARRNARNTSALLVHEAHVARVADPAGGSYTVERLTDDLARAAWSQFQQLEAEGGVVASLGADEGGLKDRIWHQAALPRRRQVATRRRPITGVSEFPHLEEALPERRPHPPAAPSADRYALAFERLRDDPRATPVLLATMGPVAEHTARAGFAANLLAAGGVRTVPVGATSRVEEVLDAYRAAGSTVACLAGPDTAYADWGADLVKALRDAGATYVVLTGRPGRRTVPARLVDDSCAAGTDAVAFLTRLREELPR